MAFYLVTPNIAKLMIAKNNSHEIPAWDVQEIS